MGENGMLQVELILRYKFYNLLFDNEITTPLLRYQVYNLGSGFDVKCLVLYVWKFKVCS